jgi:hypothetical protein
MEFGNTIILLVYKNVIDIAELAQKKRSAQGY